MAKPSVGQKASQFLSQIGTAGGPVGAMSSTGLVNFGAGDINRQLVMGNTDPYFAARTQGNAPVLGAPSGAAHPGLQSAPTMSSNLDASYVHLNMPGSPLPMYGMMTPHAVKAAQVTQDQITAMDQRMLTGMIPPTGQLPVTPMQAAMGAAQQLTAQASKQRRGGR